MKYKPGDWAIIVDRNKNNISLAPHLIGMAVLIVGVDGSAFPNNVIDPKGQKWWFRNSDLRPATAVEVLAHKLGAQL